MVEQPRASLADSRQFAGATVPAAKPAFYRGKSRKYSLVPIPSPHRSLPAPEQPQAPTAPKPGNFLTMILDNLRKAGVKGTDKKQRMRL
jgi:hypothetical protein